MPDALETFIAGVSHYQIPVVVLDTETTGFSPENDAVVQFSGIKGYLKPDGIIDPDYWEKADFYIKSPIPMPDKASEVNGITDDLLEEKGIAEEKAYERIQSFIKGCAVVGHNIPFDIRMLNGFFSRMADKNGMEKKLIKADSPFVLDTLALARKVVPGKKEDRPCALGNLIKYIGCEKNFGFHDSMEDVLATAEVYNWLVRNYR